MRYYIVDKNGNVWADSDDYDKICTILDNLDKELVESNELEIIEGE